MNRRQFLGTALPIPQAAPLTSRTQRPQATGGLEPYSGPWTYAEAAHLARRTLFGSRKSDVLAILGMWADHAVDVLLQSPPAPVPAEPIIYAGTGMGSTWASSAYDASKDNARTAFLQTWWFEQMIMQPLSINEKMTLFWANHFATSHLTVLDARYMYKQNVMLRTNALGNFRRLVDEITFDPAMMRYLNNNLNTKTSINENLGRELQELFTIGKGPEISPGNYTNYTEDDVKAAAKVLTGWKDDATSLTTVFQQGTHDTSTKQFSAAYGNATIVGKSDEIGARQEIDALLNMILDQPATAKYIVSKIYRWFVSTHIDAWTETNIIEPLATDFKNGNYEIKPVLAKLLKSAHFYDMANRGAMIKSTFDLCIGALRSIPISSMLTPAGKIEDAYPDTFLPETTNARHWALRRFRNTLGTMQQDMMNPPNVAGWPAYYQEPVLDQLWINADTLQKRIKYLDDLCSAMFIWDEHYGFFLFDVIAFAKQTSNPTSAETIVEEWAKFLFAMPLIDAQKAEALATFIAGNSAGWTTDWNAYLAEPTNETKLSAVETKLRALLRHYVGLAEYQLM
jgi:uncharacterized protein (DUF1800 family)